MTMVELIPLFLFISLCGSLILGYPVAFTLGGTALLFAGIGIVTGTFHPGLLLAFPDRLFGIMSNYTLVAVPLFVLMGVMLEKSKLAENLLDDMAKLCGSLRGGLGLAVIVVGALLAASTGVVGATVVTMGLISLPTMLKRGYDPALATGTLCATGTLGQIIPPSIALVLLGDVLSSAYQQAQLKSGVVNPATVSVSDIFAGALLPGLLLVVVYGIYLLVRVAVNPKLAPAMDSTEKPQLGRLLLNLFPAVGLILCVLGSIIAGIATPTEAAGVGAIGASLLALGQRQLSYGELKEVCLSTLRISAMVFAILVGASLFTLVFRGFGGDVLVEQLFEQLPGGTWFAILVVMVVIFFLGFILDFIEITFVVVPIVGPILLAMGVDPIWLAVMIAVNLQTSFLTPPFGFALFYLRGVTPPQISTPTIYRGVLPFIMIQLMLLIGLALWPQLATWLPSRL